MEKLRPLTPIELRNMEGCIRRVGCSDVVIEQFEDHDCIRIAFSVYRDRAFLATEDPQERMRKAILAARTASGDLAREESERITESAKRSAEQREQELPLLVQLYSALMRDDAFRMNARAPEGNQWAARVASSVLEALRQVSSETVNSG